MGLLRGAAAAAAAGTKSETTVKLADFGVFRTLRLRFLVLTPGGLLARLPADAHLAQVL